MQVGRCRGLTFSIPLLRESQSIQRLTCWSRMDGRCSERREIPSIKPLALSTVTHEWPPLRALPSLLVHLLTPQAGCPGARCLQCACCPWRRLLQDSTQGLEALLSQLPTTSAMLIIFFPKPGSVFRVLQSGRGQAFWGILLFVLKVCVRFSRTFHLL